MRMHQSRLTVAFLNLGHFLDHLAMLIYATAVLVMTSQFGLAYQDMLPLSIGGVIALGGGALPGGGARGPRGRPHTQLGFFFRPCRPPGDSRRAGPPASHAPRPPPH